MSTYMNETGLAALEVLDRVAEAHGATPGQVALAWVMARPGITCAIASATSAEQVRELTAAIDLRLGSDGMDALDAVGTVYNPR